MNEAKTAKFLLMNITYATPNQGNMNSLQASDFKEIVRERKQVKEIHFSIKFNKINK